MTPELSRVVAVDRLPHMLVVEATAAECAALAERLRIPAVHSLRCRFVLRRQGHVVEAQAELAAEVEQACVVSMEPVAQSVRESVTLRFVPEGHEGADDDPESPDEIPYTGSAIDLGEAATEQLALALDPYPRDPDAVLDPSAVDGAGGAMAGLAGLRLKQ